MRVGGFARWRSRGLRCHAWRDAGGGAPPPPPPGRPTIPRLCVHACSDYLYLNLIIAPYYPPGDASSHRRRRLAAWVGEAVSLRDAGVQANSGPLAGLPAGTVAPHLLEAEAHSDFLRRTKSLLSKPKLALAQRELRPYKANRRLLVDAAAYEPANLGEPGELPQLKVGWARWVRCGRSPLALAAAPACATVLQRRAKA